MSYRRRMTHSVTAGSATIGGNNPVVIQSMTNTPTLDTEASAAQVISIADAGAKLVRLTAQGVSHARNLANIYRTVREKGCDVAISADIHFNPAAAFEAALHVDKVRINPGNFVDPARTFKSLKYTDEEYADEIERIRHALIPLLDRCREHHTAIRLGVNHGSLSDRIMSRYGDTPAGMVESAMEFLRICTQHNFYDVVISIKSSNVSVMVDTVRLLAQTMKNENMTFPLHLGVTEAGDGDDARVKSAAGIGALLADGLGDTIRVSLAEPPENEIPVARMIIEHINSMCVVCDNDDYSEFDFETAARECTSGAIPLVVGHDLDESQALKDFGIVSASGPEAIFSIRRDIANALECGLTTAPVVKISYPAEMSPEQVTIAASVDFGALLLSPMPVNGICIDAPSLTPDQISVLSLNILQATRRRLYKTEFIACPSCGRTLFDLPSTLESVRQATRHLKGLKIAVMGCVVNGPGEMADADYGYVGAAAGHVSLYKGKLCVEKNIPQADAVARLVKLIKDNGQWVDPS